MAVTQSRGSDARSRRWGWLLVVPAIAAAVRLAPARGTNAPRAGQAAAAIALPAAVGDSTQPTRVTMRNVAFHMADGIILRIHRLDGVMHGVRGVVDFDDLSSYVTQVESAEVGMTGPDLTHLMNDHVFAYRGAPLSHLRISLTGTQLRQRGILHKGVDIPFDMYASVSLMPDGRIRLHPTRMRVLGVNGIALLNAFGLSLARLMDLSRARGVQAQGNDLLLEPTALLPPPAIEGRLSAVEVRGGELVQRFGAPASTIEPTLPDSGLTNYMLYRGGTLHFGKLSMADAEMLVVDQHPEDPFDFDNPHYQRQLIAGYSRTLPDLGLEVYMPDASAVRSASPAQPPQAAGAPVAPRPAPGPAADPQP
ncbi:MAG TPA: hypothetical protein VJU87_08845 [Gemmatimonadaceae bacterium]|nr:hypothetical protein [Gemmatimonadaceae bacterium]